MRSKNRFRLITLSSVTALGLFGCAQFNGQAVKEVFLPSSSETSAANGIDPLLYVLASGIVNTVTNLTSDDPSQKDVTLTEEQARNFPYAAQYLRLGDNPRLLTVLAFADSTGNLPNQMRLHYASSGNEIIETDGIQRLVSIQRMLGSTPEIHFAGDNSALECFAHAATVQPTQRQQALNNCPSEAQWAMDITQEYVPFTPVKPRYIDQRVQATAHYSISDTNASVTLATGEVINTIKITESAKDGSFHNEFFINPASGQAIKSSQWLGERLGYLQIEQVRAAMPASYTAPAATADTLQLAINGTHINLANRSRISQVLEHIAVADPGSYYAPLIRLNDCTLQQQLDARKQGMLVRLRLLQQTYQADGDTELQQHAKALEQEFLSWPLKATYLHGASLANARLSLSNNLQLPEATGKEAICNAANQFELSLGQPFAAKAVGLTHTNSQSVWVIRSNGDMRHVPLSNPDHQRNNQHLLQQPNSLVLYSIAEQDLPPGFKDLNQQLALFLQHWDVRHVD